MDLLKYLEPMKHLPDRFSNLAFWRGCRKFKDAVVNAFEYVDSWGESIESEIANLPTAKLTNVSASVTHSIQSGGGAKQTGANQYSFYLQNTNFDICDIPDNAIGVSIRYCIEYSVGSTKYYISPPDYTTYTIANGKLHGTWGGNYASWYDPVLTSDNYNTFENPYLIYEVIFSLSE